VPLLDILEGLYEPEYGLLCEVLGVVPLSPKVHPGVPLIDILKGLCDLCMASCV